MTVHSGTSVTLSAAPHSSYGTVRIWYLYTATSSALPSTMLIAPQLVQQQRAAWIDSNFLNQNDNLSDLPNAGTARTNLGFSSQTIGQVLYGNGASTFDSESALFWDSSNDRLGLGTNSPQQRLHLNDSGANALGLEVTNSVSGATSGDGLLVGLDASGNAVINQRENLPLIFSTNNAEVGRFLSTGPLLLKTGLQLEDPGAGTSKVTIQSPTLSADYTLTLPTTDGNASEVLTTDGSGVTSWSTFSSLSPLTTKGDILAYSTLSTRLAVGATFGQVLTVDSSQTTGLAWGSVVKAGTTAIATTQTQKAIVFTNAMPSRNYSVHAYLANYADSTPMRMVVLPIVKTTAGFTVEWDNQTDSANYVLEWIAIGHSS